MNNIIKKFILYIKDKNYSKYTIICYQKDLSDFNDFLIEININNINQIDYKILRKYLASLYEKKYSSKTIARKISTLKSMYKYLIKNKLVKTNPMSLIKIPKLDNKLPKFLYYEELEELLALPKTDNVLGIRNSLILEMLYSTGIRVSEIVNIKLKDINHYDKKILILGKGNKERYVIYGNKMEDKLNLYLSNAREKLLKIDTNYLLINKNGTQLSDRGVRKIITTIIQNSSMKMNISPHTIRHTFSTHMLDSGADIRIVQELLGHTSLATTQIYTHVSNEKLRKVYYENHPRAIRKEK